MKGTYLMYLVHHHEPVTAREIHRMAGGEKRHIETELRYAWKDDVLIRRRRRHGDGDPPFEYAIAPLPDQWERARYDEGDDAE